MTTDQAVTTFAMDRILLGETPLDGGAPSTTAWMEYGYNLDGLVTTRSSTNVCEHAPNAPTTNQADGVNGIDNAWGALYLPIIQGLARTAVISQVVSTAITSGAWTLQIQIAGLSTDSRQSALGLDAEIFVSGQGPGGPSFGPTTDWPVLSSSLLDGATLGGGALVRFTTVYVTDGILVAEGSSQPVVVPLKFPVGPFCGNALGACDAGGTQLTASLPLRIHHPVLTFVHVDPSTAAHGVIAGVLDTGETIGTLQALAGGIAPALCGSAFDGIAEQIAQLQDISNDATNAPGIPCSGISIGIGFTAKLVANPTKVVSDPGTPNPCDAGTDAQLDAGAD